MEKDAKIFVAGHRGLVGSAIKRLLEEKGYKHILVRTHQELDLVDQNAVANFFEQEKPEYVVLAAAKVGGIHANNVYRGDFIYHNLMIQNNVVHQSYLHAVKKLLFLGSTCIYPKASPQPIKEDYLLSSQLEYTNEPYAIAKIAGIKLCESYNIQYGTNFMSVMPTNLYGPNDNFHLENSHVLPALLRKLHLGKLIESGDYDALRKDLTVRPIAGVNGSGDIEEVFDVLAQFGVTKNAAVEVEIWGSGKPLREFLWSEDMADACIYVMEKVEFKHLVPKNTEEIINTHINIGTGKEISIRDLANLIKDKVGFGGELLFNDSKPDGTMRKLTDCSKLHNLGWKHKIELDQGIAQMYTWYLQN